MQKVQEPAAPGKSPPITRPCCPRCGTRVAGKRQTGTDHYRCSGCSLVFTLPLRRGEAPYGFDDLEAGERRMQEAASAPERP